MKEKRVAERKVKFDCERLTAKKMNKIWAGDSSQGGTNVGGVEPGAICICGCKNVRPNVR